VGYGVMQIVTPWCYNAKISTSVLRRLNAARGCCKRTLRMCAQQYLHYGASLVNVYTRLMRR